MTFAAAGPVPGSERETIPAVAGAKPSVLGRLAVQLGLVLLVCVAVYWVRLGADGFISSEGHRVIPAWAMLDSGDHLVPRLFEQIYLRKPPGMFWAVALFSEFLGRTEFAARAVSATAMTLGALLSLVFARRWFGGLDPKAGLVAGLAHALTPWFWQIGRAAEIEALHQLAVQASVLLLIDVTVGGEPRSRARRIVLAGATGLAMAGMVLVKGPAGVPCIVGALGAACIVARSIRPLFLPVVRGAVLVTVVVLVVVFGAMLSAVARTGGGAVSQSLDEFLWAPERVWDVVMLLPTALGSALPLAFSLLYPWGWNLDLRAPTARIARAIALACIIALTIYLVVGVSNRRYVLPAFSFLAPLAAFAAVRVASGVIVGLPGPIARALLFDRPAAWFAGVVIFAGIWLGYIEPRRAAHGGRAPGLALAEAIARQGQGDAELWADDMVEARPDVLEYAVRDLSARGRVLRVRWLPIAESPDFPPPGGYLVIRTDPGSEELRVFTAAGLQERAELVDSGRLREFTWDVYRVRVP